MAKLRAARGKNKVVKAKAKTKIGLLKILSVTQFENFAKLKKAKLNNVKQFTDFLFKYSKDLFNVISLKNKSYDDIYELNAKVADWITNTGFDTDQFEDYFIKKSKIGNTAAKKTSNMHKDTKSHNVNIRVVSGMPDMNGDLLQKMKDTISEIKDKQDYIDSMRKKIPSMELEDRKKYRSVVQFYVTWVKQLKSDLREYKKLLK
jgi:hypothetical protein